MAGKPLFWTPENIEVLRKHCNDPWEDLVKLFGKKRNAIYLAMRDHSIRRKRVYSLGPVKYKDEALREVVDGFLESQKLYRYKEGDDKKIAELKDKIVSEVFEKQKAAGRLADKITWAGITHLARRITVEDLKRIDRKSVSLPLRWSNMEKVKKEGKDSEITLEEKLGNILEEKNWNDPDILEIKKEDWDYPGVRVGCISGIAYFNKGFRAGLVNAAFELFRSEATHFNVLNGHVVDKKALKEKIRKDATGLKAEERAEVAGHVIEEAAKALAALIPKIKKPRESGKSKDKYVRLYIMTSPKLDGELGDAIIRRLQELRPDDIRQYNEGGDRLPFKGLDMVLWFLNPTKNRLPGRYYSQATEKEIIEKVSQTSQKPPDLWGVGGFASNIHIPDGIRPQPYFSIPALRRLEEVHAAENQVGVTVLNFPDKERYSIKSWSYRDLISEERRFITGISRGANDTHRNIVEAVKVFGSLTSGLLSDKTGISRETIEKEIQFLLEEEMSQRKTWPGLHYNKSSQRFDFHLRWIQERLRYPALPTDLKEDSIVFFGCLHAGYATTDYRYAVEKLPEIILGHKIQILCGLGDFIAGLHHDFLCSGEIFGQMNNTEQEKLAADVIATILYRVFESRFLEKTAGKNLAKLSQEELVSLVGDSLMTFLYIHGNHDLWQLKDGNMPLVVFRYRLQEVLIHYISKLLGDACLSAISLYQIIDEKLTLFPDYKAFCTLPSGLTLGMMHPHMARAQTTSLRAQHAIGMNGCQITGIANFHTAAVVHEWNSKLGQCVVVQAGTGVIYTRFEERKMKGGVDFGPIMLKVHSYNKRIIKTESAFFNKPFLAEAIPKTTDPDQLRKDLNILTV